MSASNFHRCPQGSRQRRSSRSRCGGRGFKPSWRQCLRRRRRAGRRQRRSCAGFCALSRISPTWRLRLKSGGSIWRRRTFTKLCAATTAAGAMRRACSPFATAIALASAAGSRRAPARPSLSVTANAPARTLTFRWRTPTMTSATPRRPRLSGCAMRGSTVVSIGWGDGGKTIEHEAGPQPSNKD